MKKKKYPKTKVKSNSELSESIKNKRDNVKKLNSSIKDKSIKKTKLLTSIEDDVTELISRFKKTNK